MATRHQLGPTLKNPGLPGPLFQSAMVVLSHIQPSRYYGPRVISNLRRYHHGNQPGWSEISMTGGPTHPSWPKRFDRPLDFNPFSTRDILVSILHLGSVGYRKDFWKKTEWDYKGSGTGEESA
ncbi:hypothetical protein Acr_00g0052760 [Actinidia rufa]|uniref:Uncharacterized protein n=1 Tax=Actinidia rufa TaxID=165716 RepID=A0A7J0DLE9_9ERIC|nr:hypothetical protein Acr_00g0052760 [Actinidia rufa]